MTQSFGFYCPECGLRWRRSVCDLEKNICPSGHLLANCYWVYRKTYMKSISISINGPKGFHLLDSVSRRGTNKALITLLKEKIQQLTEDDPTRAEVYQDLMSTSSEAESSWPLKCWNCQWSRKKRGYYPGELERPFCEKGVEWATIYCKDFIRDRKNAGTTHAQT